jgi:hypothetical protein
MTTWTTRWILLVMEQQKRRVLGSPIHALIADIVVQWDKSNNSKIGIATIGASVRPVLASFVAGGLAGQAHYCMSYYTRHWKRHFHSHHHHHPHYHHSATKPPTRMPFPMAVATRKISLAGMARTACSFSANGHYVCGILIQWTRSGPKNGKHG